MRCWTAVAVAAIAAAAACGGSVDGERSPSLEVTTVVPRYAADDLPDGRHFGFVTALDPARFRLVFDRAALLEGTEARAAAEEDGSVVTEGGFYVRDLDDGQYRVTLDLAIRVRLLVPCCEPTAVTFEQWLAGFAPDDRTYYGTADSHYWITVTDGRVVEVEEAYVP